MWKKSRGLNTFRRHCIYSTKSMCTCVCIVRLLSHVCMRVSVPMFVLLHSPCSSIKCFLIFKKISNFTACISYLMWNRVPCSHGSMQYFAPHIVCSGLGDCEELSVYIQGPAVLPCSEPIAIFLSPLLIVLLKRQSSALLWTYFSSS